MAAKVKKQMLKENQNFSFFIIFTLTPDLHVHFLSFFFSVNELGRLWSQIQVKKIHPLFLKERQVSELVHKDLPMRSSQYDLPALHIWYAFRL